MKENNEFYFSETLKLAEKSSKNGDVPIGAIIVLNNKIISKGFNNREKKHDILGHAEIMAIKKASKKLKTWKLNDCIMYVTLKPCSMCESIIKQSRIKSVYYLLDKSSQKKEYNKTNIEKLNVVKLESVYKQLLSEFFAKFR